jgi:hypothetical protein
MAIRNNKCLNSELRVWRNIFISSILVSLIISIGSVGCAKDQGKPSVTASKLVEQSTQNTPNTPDPSSGSGADVPELSTNSESESDQSTPSMSDNFQLENVRSNESSMQSNASGSENYSLEGRIDEIGW